MRRPSSRRSFATAGASSLATSPAGIAANDRKNLAGDVAGTARRGEENKRRCDLFRLGGPLHRRAAAEFSDFVGLAVRRIERSPNRPLPDGLDPDALWSPVRPKGPWRGMH